MALAVLMALFNAGRRPLVCFLFVKLAAAWSVSALLIVVQVRFRVHVVTAAFNTAVAMFGVLWQWSTSSPHLALAELMGRLVIGCAVPLLLVHLWEHEERRWFLEEAAGRQPGRGTAAKAKTL
jgi:hypothetical protein